jgi:hypothetical protein
MTSSVQTILSSINKYHDLQRQSRFKVFFDKVPGCCPNLADLSLRCESIDLPGRALNTFDHRTYGPVVKYPTQSFFGEITLTFICSANRSKSNIPFRDDGLSSSSYTGMDEKTTFENWMNYINTYPSSSNRSPNYPYHNFRYKNQYIADIFVICYDTDDKPSYRMDFERAFPVSIGQIPMSWTSEEVARVPVTFTYDFFRYTNECECGPETGALVYSTNQPRQQQSTPETPRQTQPLPPYDINGINPSTGLFNGQLGLGDSQTPTYQPGA